MLDPLVPVIEDVLREWPQIRAPRMTELLRGYGYAGSVELVKRQVVQVDWAEMPTRPRIMGRERRVYAQVFSLPYSGTQTAHFSFDMTVEAFLEGHVRALAWLGGVPRECVYHNLRAAVAKREHDRVTWSQRFVHLRGHYAFHATADAHDHQLLGGQVDRAFIHDLRQERHQRPHHVGARTSSASRDGGFASCAARRSG